MLNYFRLWFCISKNCKKTLRPVSQDSSVSLTVTAESRSAQSLTPQNKAQRCQWFMGKGLKDIFLKHILTTYMVSATTRSQTYCNVRPLWVNHQDLYLHFYTVSISYNLYMKTTIIKIFIYIFTWLVFLTFYIWRRQSSRALYTCLHG